VEGNKALTGGPIPFLELYYEGGDIGGVGASLGVSTFCWGLRKLGSIVNKKKETNHPKKTKKAEKKTLLRMTLTAYSPLYSPSQWDGGGGMAEKKMSESRVHFCYEKSSSAQT